MASILAWFDPDLKALYNDILMNEPASADIFHRFDGLSKVEQCVLIQGLKNDTSLGRGGQFLRLHELATLEPTIEVDLKETEKEQDVKIAINIEVAPKPGSELEVNGSVVI